MQKVEQVVVHWLPERGDDGDKPVHVDTRLGFEGAIVA